MKLPRYTTTTTLLLIPFWVLSITGVLSNTIISGTNFGQLIFLLFLVSITYWIGFHFFSSKGKSNFVGGLCYMVATATILSVLLRIIVGMNITDFYIPPTHRSVWQELTIVWISIEPWYYHVYTGIFVGVVGFTSSLVEFPKTQPLRAFVWGTIGGFIFMVTPDIVDFLRLFNPQAIAPSDEWRRELITFTATGEGVLFIVMMLVFVITLLFEIPSNR